MAIATGFSQSVLAEWNAGEIEYFAGSPYIVILAVVIIMVNFLTEITSNVATASILLPILASIAAALGFHPYSLMVGACLAASCAFMLPVATPPNAIVFSSGYIKMTDMVRVGFWMNIISVLVVLLAMKFLLPMVWDMTVMPLP